MVKYDPNKVGIRTILEEIETIGYEAKYVPQTEKVDIRSIVNEESLKQQRKLYLSLLFQIPISILIWIIPFS